MTKKTFDVDPTDKNGLKWFEYRQNNSGGSFVKDDDVSIHVVVQANNLTEANRIAEDRAGVYFDGVRSGYDCGCCGDRWNGSWNEDGMEFTVMSWGLGGYDTAEYQTIEDWAEAMTKEESWSKVGESVVVLYYYQGPKVVYYKD